MEERRNSAGSAVSSSDLYSTPERQAANSVEADDRADDAHAKRKRERSESPPGKKRKVHESASPAFDASVAPACAGLPAQIWQAVFLHLDPAALREASHVNRAFRFYLLHAHASPGAADSGVLSLRNSDFIWASARRTHFPTMPKPLQSLTEWDMWNLIAGKKCQFCRRGNQSDSSGQGPWDAGPGESGIRIIWAFAIRTCGKCLQQRVEKDTTLLLSPASSLLAALPYIFLKSDLNVVLPAILQDVGSIPPNVQLSKVYYKRHVEEMQTELEHARSLGTGAAEGWFNGLGEIGQSKIRDAARWERWEAKGNFDGFVTRPSIPSVPTPPTSVHTPATTLTFPRSVASPFGAAPASLPPRPVMPPQHVLQQSPYQGGVQPHRGERSIKQINEAKAARKAEVERRCLSMQPAIPPNVLRHMDAFNAATQIPKPLDNDQWETLKPRLLAQLSTAQRVESERSAQMSTMQVKVDDRRQQDVSLKEAKEVVDREWEEAQRPVRERLGRYADEAIRRDWADGKMVDRGNSARFAAEVLIHVRERFYSDLADEDEALVAAGKEIPQDPDQGPPTRKLVLENMKWVFDNKIKAVTEPYRRELFFCNGCEGNFKPYGFEGVIQHYGAKHTNAFSVGNIVVHWQSAEWPEEPPFNPDPDSVKPNQFVNPAAGFSGPYYPGQPAYAPYGYGGYSRGMSTTPSMSTMGPQHMTQISPGPYGQHPYASPMNGPFPPPQGPPPPGPPGGFHHQGYPGPPLHYGQIPAPFYSPPQPGYHGAPPPFDGYAPYQGLPQPAYGGPPGPGYPAPYQPHDYPDYPPQGGMPLSHGGQGPPMQQYALQAPHPPPVEQAPVPSGLMADPMYDERKSEVAQVARKIWSSTTVVKDLATSVRVHVIIHHVVSKFKSRFSDEPSLDLFADALASHHLMRSIRNASGLYCRSCAREHPAAQSHSMDGVERKAYSLSGLVFHFKSTHVRRADSAPALPHGPHSFGPSWTEDMIDLPDADEISELIRAPGMDDEKLRMIADCFPLLFPTPLPHIGTVSSRTPVNPSPAPPALVAPTDSRKPRAHERSATIEAESPGNRTPAQAPGHVRVPSTEHPHGRSPQSLPPAGEDEYDPRRPAMDSGYAQNATERHHQSLRPRSPVIYERRRGDPYSGRGYHTTREAYDDDFAVPPNAQYRPRSPYAAPHFRYLDHPGEGTITMPPPQQNDDATSDLASTGGPDASAQGLTSSAREDSYQPEELPVAAAPISSGPDISSDNRAPSPLAGQGEAAAERFLNHFLEGRDMEEYKRKAAEQNRLKEESLRAQWRAEQETEIRPASGVPGPQAGPSQPGEDDPSGPRDGQPLTFRPDDRFSTGQHPPQEYYVEAISPRYARHVSVYKDDPYPSRQRIVRSRSRFERYEAERLRLERQRSRSPPHHPDSAGPDPRYLASRSPDPGSVNDGDYRRHHPRELPPGADDAPPYSPGPAVVRYRYADAPPPRHVDQYGEPVQYVRVREPYPAPRYVQGPPPPATPTEHEGMVEYVAYDRGPRREVVYDDHRHVYYPEPRVYEHAPPSSERRVFEEPPAGHPGREMRYVEPR